MNLREFVPPVLIRLLGSRKPSVFGSYAEAAAASGKGYGDERLARVVLEKTKAYRDRLAGQPANVDYAALRPLIAVLLSGSGAELNVIDFGGGCGAHYFLAKRIVGNRCNLRWHVVETPVMVAHASALADESLAFYDDIESAATALRSLDLVYSSGALHYLPDPMATLKHLTELGASKIFLTRLGISLREGFVVVQSTRLSDNGPGQLPPGITDETVRYPATFIAKNKIEEVLANSYTIEMIVDEGERLGTSTGHETGTFGYYASRSVT